ncbi:hypothetical protein ACFODO_23495 [Acinetobacter sichuanensis]|uniref:Uncharacterized protein n=1 Tax=Acinetobacter sichuanensis TaxID=2136183 RepID=A0A371YPQ1_9GAMM|nr:hypothetical protein [Acinetobacter sichuanensis]RFC83433.1 hypothetical protein C9E89_011325 [Acinetobacter sichuanensis]
MHPLVPHTSSIALGEALTAATNMVKEITHYKRTLAELELQRIQMHEQAKIAHHQIENQLKQNMYCMESLSNAFHTTMQQNAQLLTQYVQREQDAQQQCMLILQQIGQTNDLESKKQLQSMWQELIKQMNLNREESARLQSQLIDAHQQFGLNLSHRDQSFKDIN